MHLKTVMTAIFAPCSTVKIRSVYTPCAIDILDNCIIFDHSGIVYVEK